jgi:hypothetical protein
MHSISHRSLLGEAMTITHMRRIARESKNIPEGRILYVFTDGTSAIDGDEFAYRTTDHGRMYPVTSFRESMTVAEVKEQIELALQLV